MLDPDSFRHRIDFFNRMVDEDGVNLVPDSEAWAWFLLGNVPYHGRSLTILWDRNGSKFGKGRGLRVFADGREIGSAPTLRRLTSRF